MSRCGPFPDDAKVEKIDSWAFYKGSFSRIRETKVVDFVCVRGFECWLVEVKDYRQHDRAKPSVIWDEVALKARDTLAHLATARCNANVASGDLWQGGRSGRKSAGGWWHSISNGLLALVSTTGIPSPRI